MSTTTVNNSTPTTKVETKKFDMRAVAKRTDLYTIDPREIVVDWDSNPRLDYGGEDFQELKESIRNEGVEMPLVVYVDKADGNRLKLAHGFRRMKAVLELVEEGVEIVVPFKRVTNNLETILSMHLTLNNGKPLSDNEIASTLTQMFKLMGEDYQKVAKKANMDYQKVYKLINWDMNASTLNKEMVANKEISLSNAMQVAKQANNTIEQNEILTKARETATTKGKTKIKGDDLSGIKTATLPKRDDTIKALKGFVKYLVTMGVQQIDVTTLEESVNALETGAGMDELIDNYMTS